MIVNQERQSQLPALSPPSSGGRNNTVVSIFGVEPHRIGSGEAFAREVSLQLGERGWNNVLCYLTQPVGAVRDFLSLPNVSIEVVEDSWKLSSKATFQLSKILRRYRPRILHSYFTGFLSPYPWLARLSGVEKQYFTDQGSRAEGFVPRRALLPRRLLMRAVDAPVDGVISVSNYGYTNFTALDLFPKERFQVIYNAVDIDHATAGLKQRMAFRQRFNIPDDCVLITQTSWLIPEKGLDDLLVAAREVLAAHPKVHFMLVGDGAHRKNLERTAAELGIAAHVTFAGVIKDPLGEGVFSASDIVCQMSRWEEVFGWVNAEAMASYRPLVGTRVGGMPEIIEDGVSGFLVPRRDTAAMAARICELVRDPAMRTRFGAAGRRIVERKFNLKSNTRQLIDLYGI